MKARLFKSTILLLIIAGLLTLAGEQYVTNKNTVEAFCNVKYAHDVDSYKACKVLSPNKLIQQLTDQEKDKYSLEVPKVSLTPVH